MSKSLILLLPALLLITSSSLAEAQEPGETRSAGTQAAEKPLSSKRDVGAKKAELAQAAQTAKVRRAQARSLLISLAADARTFGDPTLRSRSLARIADVLWPVDAHQARLLFGKAWEAAEVAYKEGQLKLEEETRRQKAKTGGASAVDFPVDVRREVLRMAARHDRVLGEEFLERLKAQNHGSTTSTDAIRHSTDLDEALSQRLAIAQELLSVGDVRQALQFADPVLGAITIETVGFLSNLRRENAALADGRYAAMLARASSNLDADANAVSLLSSYLFTPDRFLIFNSGDVSNAMYGTPVGMPEVTPELRSAFFQTAAGILLRQQPLATQDRSAPGVDGKYLVIKHLLPFFEQFAAQEIADAVRGHFSALNSIVSERIRRRPDDWGSRDLTSEGDQEQSILDRIDRVRTSAERDDLYLQLAHIAMGRGDIRAREFVSKIEDLELRKQAQPFIDARLAQHFVEKKRIEEALELARKGELTPIQKVWVLTRCATQLAKGNRELALEVVDEAVVAARRIDVSDLRRPQGLFAIANVLISIEATRVWEATFDAVKAANSAQGFTGEDGELALRFQRKGHSVIYGNDVPEFDVKGIFGELAMRDYERAVELARGFEGEGPRAAATIAIAHAVLRSHRSR